MSKIYVCSLIVTAADENRDALLLQGSMVFLARSEGIPLLAIAALKALDRS